MALREQKWGQTPCGHVYVPGTWHCTVTHPNQLSVGSVASLESHAAERPSWGWGLSACVSPERSEVPPGLSLLCRAETVGTTLLQLRNGAR